MNVWNVCHHHGKIENRKNSAMFAFLSVKGLNKKYRIFYEYKIIINNDFDRDWNHINKDYDDENKDFDDENIDKV